MTSIPKDTMLMLAVAMGMKKRASQAPVMPQLPSMNSGVTMGAIPGADSLSMAMPTMNEGLAGRLGLDQIFGQGVNPFSVSFSLDVATSKMNAAGVDLSSLTGGSSTLSASAKPPTMPAKSPNMGLMALALMMLQEKEDTEAKTETTKPATAKT